MKMRQGYERLSVGDLERLIVHGVVSSGEVRELVVEPEDEEQYTEGPSARDLEDAARAMSRVMGTECEIRDCAVGRGLDLIVGSRVVYLGSPIV